MKVDGDEVAAEYWVTDFMRLMLSVRERKKPGHMLCFGLGTSNLILDSTVIASVKGILQKSMGFNITKSGGAFVLDSVPRQQ